MPEQEQNTDPNQNYNPELYTEEEIDRLEACITENFGDFDNVFHEIVSPDIHVDIALVKPTPEHNYYKLITMGMGAHRMNIPKELEHLGIDRAELMVCLPPDWAFDSDDEEWYWPMRWLKVMARLPGNYDTWLGWGHTVPGGKSFASKTVLSGMLVLTPGAFGDVKCEMPDGSAVHFYQLVPLHEDEMNYKLENGAEALVEKMSVEALQMIMPERPSCI